MSCRLAPFTGPKPRAVSASPQVGRSRRHGYRAARAAFRHHAASEMSSAFLSRPGSTLGSRVVELAEGECILLAPAARVRIDDRAVLWNGTKLAALSLVFVEEPLVPWPQPVAEPRAGESVTELQRRGLAARERRALHASALRLLARETRVVNEPERAAQLACSAALALERLELAGV